MKKILILLFIISFEAALNAQPKYSELSSRPGAFSRMGFGARGIGMGNAMSAITEGNLVSYYNPAVSSFQNNNLFQTSYSFLSLDRSLNFLSFTRRFDFYSAKDSSIGNPKPRSSAGLSIGIINAGVSKIDGRDGSGFHTGELSTSENQFFIGLSNRFSERFSAGIAVKFYYYKLYEDVSSTGFGLDIGILYKLNEFWNFSLMLSDINSKYKWDTTPVYEQDGTTSEEKLPLLKKIGTRYKNDQLGLIASFEFENSYAGTNILRAGLEFNIIDVLYLRAGVDQFNMNNSDFPAKPSAGFSFFKDFNSVTIGVDYAFMMEQYSPHDRHVVGLNVRF